MFNFFKKHWPFRQDPKEPADLAEEWLDLPVGELQKLMETKAVQAEAGKLSLREAEAMMIVADTMQERLEPLTWNRAKRRAMKKMTWICWSFRSEPNHPGWPGSGSKLTSYWSQT